MVNCRLALRPDKRDGRVEADIIVADAVCFPEDSPIELADAYWWIATSGVAVAGFAGIRYLSGENVGLLARAGVLPKYRGKGIHKQLIRARLRYAKRAGWGGVITYAMSDNYASINALTHCGLRVYRPQHPWVGTDGIVYLRRLFR